jgi:hypothetical protein
MHRLAYLVTAAVFAAVPVSVGLVVDPSLVEEVRVPAPRSAAPGDTAASALPEQSSTPRPSTVDEHRRADRPHRKTAAGTRHSSAPRTRENRVPVGHHVETPGAHTAVELVSRVTPPSPADIAAGRDHVGVQPRRQPTSQEPGDDGRPQPDRGDEGGPGPSTRSGPSHPDSGSGDSGSGGSGSGGSGSGDSGSDDSGSGGSH